MQIQSKIWFKDDKMNKKLAIFSLAITLCLAGIMFVNGCDEKATAVTESKESNCQVKATAGCSKTVESTCTIKDKASACPTDCKKECCAAKQKAGTCPLQSDKTTCPKVCPKKADTCPNKS